MGWWIAAGVLLLLGMLPLGGRVHYGGGGLDVWALLGPVKLRLYPRPKKKKTEPDKNKKQKAEPEKGPQPPKPPVPPPEEKPKEKGGSLTDFIPLAKLAVKLLGDFWRKLRVNNLYVRLVLAGDDPADLGTNYGYARAALGNLLPNLERFVRIGKRDIQVGCDFAGDETLITVRLDLTIRLGQLICLAAVYGVRGLKEFLIFKNKRKGGAKNEPKTSQHVGIDHSENS